MVTVVRIAHDDRVVGGLSAALLVRGDGHPADGKAWAADHGGVGGTAEGDTAEGDTAEGDKSRCAHRKACSRTSMFHGSSFPAVSSRMTAGRTLVYVVVDRFRDEPPRDVVGQAVVPVPTTRSSQGPRGGST